MAWTGGALSRLAILPGAVRGSILAALSLLFSLVLQDYWALDRGEPPLDRLTFVKTLLVISARLALARLADRAGNSA